MIRILKGDNCLTSTEKTIVVSGATGKQGGAVLNSLLKAAKWKVIALTRNPESREALEIKKRGVEIRKADLQDKSSLRSAFEDAYGVYGVTTPLLPNGKIDTQMEQEQGYGIVDSCVENGVKHLVLSTVLYISEDQTAIPYVKSKLDIENYVIKNSIPFTFLRPSSFMDEIGGEYLPVKKNKLTGQADGDAKIPYVACEDIGKFARKAFDNPEKFISQKINLVGDFISGEELAQVLSKITDGKQFKHKAPPIWLMWLFAREWIPLRKQFEIWGRPPHPEKMMQAVSNSKKLLPEILSFEQFLKAHGYEKK